jgi:hypothetical protein
MSKGDDMDVARTAPDALKLLWKNGFFFKQKTVKEIKLELEKNGYNFEEHNLMMALKNAKFLTRKGNEGSYSYAQKHPFVDDINDRLNK